MSNFRGWRRKITKAGLYNLVAVLGYAAAVAAWSDWRSGAMMALGAALLYALDRIIPDA